MQGLLFSVLEQGRAAFDPGSCDLVACAAAFELLEPLASRGPGAAGAGATPLTYPMPCRRFNPAGWEVFKLLHCCCYVVEVCLVSGIVHCAVYTVHVLCLSHVALLLPIPNLVSLKMSRIWCCWPD